MDAPSILQDVESLERVRTDRSGYVPATLPDGVVIAQTIDDVVATLQYATEHSIPVVTRGAGSGLAGGSSASRGEIVLDVGGTIFKCVVTRNIFKKIIYPNFFQEIYC